MSAIDRKKEEEGTRIYDGERLVWVVQGGRRVRPKGWNAARAIALAAKRLEKMEARKTIRGKRRRRSSLHGWPAAINRWTGKPHEHNRAKARRLASGKGR